MTQQLMIFAVSFTRTKYGKIQHDKGFCQCHVFHIVSLNSVVVYCWHFESSFASSVDVHCRFRFRFSLRGLPKWHCNFLWLSAAMRFFGCGWDLCTWLEMWFVSASSCTISPSEPQLIKFSDVLKAQMVAPGLMGPPRWGNRGEPTGRSNRADRRGNKAIGRSNRAICWSKRAHWAEK